MRDTLRGSRGATSSQLARALDVTSQTVRRLLAELPASTLLVAGQRSQTRYALRRPLRGSLQGMPLFAVGADGHAAELPTLTPVEPNGTHLPIAGSTWPAPPESKSGWWDGLPYPIYGMRPAGYLGRLFARAEHVALAVSDDPEAWSDDDILWVLSRRGVDVPGNLILGAQAYDAWLRARVADPQPLSSQSQPEAYAKLALQAVTVGGGGSSAAGEFPKFAALRDLPDATTPHVLVKFSGASGSTSERRWGDLLVCEHLALEAARKLAGVSSACSRIVLHAGRVFLETERFDRVGLHGRLPVCSLDAVEPAFIGSRETAWPALARRLHELRLIEADVAAAIERLWWYGRLIANTDMHLGNLTCHVDSPLRLAPAYDMLPMAYAPLPGGEVAPRVFAPDLPHPGQRPAWLSACEIALAFWVAAGADVRISESFRVVCRDNAARLRDLADRV
ncbi:MAG: type II toxin-antitoxin system HipA family toxin YjjJ [Burkholderiales bacterium]|nr:type II toxin-antitoxin system HipA family toxin YjjJ [Burkholderiales bacterium]